MFLHDRLHVRHCYCRFCTGPCAGIREDSILFLLLKCICVNTATDENENSNNVFDLTDTNENNKTNESKTKETNASEDPTEDRANTETDDENEKENSNHVKTNETENNETKTNATNETENSPYLHQNPSDESINSRNGAYKNTEESATTETDENKNSNDIETNETNETKTTEISESDDSNGDRENKFQGDALSHKNQNTTRIYCQNVNGLDVGRGGGDINSICIDMKRTRTDILLATETRVCHRHMKIRKTIKKTAQSILEHALVVIASSRIKYPTYKKPGGTMIFTHGKTRGRVTEYKTDNYGRWSWMILDTHQSGIVIVSIYQPSNQEDYKLDGKKGKKTFRLQQHSMILQDKRQGSPLGKYSEKI